MTELRNTIYEHFIDLEAHPCTGNATKLLWINRQIRAEFGSFYLSQGNATVYFDDVVSFLRAFIIPPANLVYEEVACKIRVELCKCDSECKNWELDMVDVVSIMRQFPLLSIEWNLVLPGRSEACDHTDIATVVSVLNNMNNTEFERFASFHLQSYGKRFDGHFQITLKSYCTEQDCDDILPRFLRLGCSRLSISVA